MAQQPDLPTGDVLTSDPALIRSLMEIGESAWCVVLDEMPREAKRGLRETLARLIAQRAETSAAAGA